MINIYIYILILIRIIKLLFWELFLIISDTFINNKYQIGHTNILEYFYVFIACDTMILNYINFTLYTVYNVQYELYCTLYTVQCTWYNDYIKWINKTGYSTSNLGLDLYFIIFRYIMYCAIFDYIIYLKL